MGERSGALRAVGCSGSYNTGMKTNPRTSPFPPRRFALHSQGYAMILEDKTPNKATGHWKNYELEALKRGLEEHGPDWHKIAELIPTRSWSQIVRKGKHMIGETRGGEGEEMRGWSEATAAYYRQSQITNPRMSPSAHRFAPRPLLRSPSSSDGDEIVLKPSHLEKIRAQKDDDLGLLDDENSQAALPLLGHSAALAKGYQEYGNMYGQVTNPYYTGQQGQMGQDGKVIPPGAGGNNGKQPVQAGIPLPLNGGVVPMLPPGANPAMVASMVAMEQFANGIQQNVTGGNGGQYTYGKQQFFKQPNLGDVGAGEGGERGDADGGNEQDFKEGEETVGEEGKGGKRKAENGLEGGGEESGASGDRMGEEKNKKLKT